MIDKLILSFLSEKGLSIVMDAAFFLLSIAMIKFGSKPVSVVGVIVIAFLLMKFTIQIIEWHFLSRTKRF
ncbi:hypothetical protein [Nissabacter sp. SGAir0207]|uniref:hypothetical protein n=1 Tax=Nissabacter sp. SGAir0207 TaxID=2126321 RepID=UPI0010CCD484|nr:hypothetical protein [Nissabacter sp. SGAir0207]QCR38634.1 hypothetical protein C1N62_21045 [Nissabacter sp. SGAir0207]